jgi:hypothetical protein
MFDSKPLVCIDARTWLHLHKQIAVSIWCILRVPARMLTIITLS